MADAPTIPAAARWAGRTDETIAFLGGAVKALGGGKLGGLLVPFGSPDATDSQGEYFTQFTDFGLDVTSRARVVYHHGATKAFGPRKLGIVEYAIGAAGVEVTAGALDLADDAVKGLHDRVEAGELFWSSGSTERLRVRREVRAGVNEITAWPIIEVSLTPSPVDRRAKAFAVKGLLTLDDLAWDPADDPPLGRFSAMRAARAALCSLGEDAMDRLCAVLAAAAPAADRVADARTILDALSAASLAAIEALIADDPAALKAVLTNHGGGAPADAAGSLAARTERLVADASVISGLYRKAADQRAAEGRHLSPAKRAAIKALADGLGALASVPPPKADPAAVRALRNRLLAARI